MAIDDLGAEVWRGSVAAWECDDMGHMNTRFYVTRLEEGCAMLLAQLGVPGTMSPDSRRTFATKEMHIRFHREARLSTLLRMTGSVIEAGSGDARFLFLLTATESGELMASFRVRGSLVSSGDGVSPVDWPAGFLDRAASRMVPVPDAALPRGSADDPVSSIASLDMAECLGLTRITAGIVTRARTDAFGRMAPHHFIGSVSDGVRLLSGSLRDIVAENAPEPVARPGGAVVEFRILHLDPPREGDPYEIRGGLRHVSGHSYALVFWMFDPLTGRALGTMESIAVTFDLDARKIVRISDAARARLNALTVPGLAL